MTNGRWWEFYFVRYAMGTIVGVLIVSSLMRVDKQLGALVNQLIKDFTGDSRFIAMSALGLVYCYIASIPILIFHAARSLMNIEQRKELPSGVKNLRDFGLPIAVVAVIYGVPTTYLALGVNLLKSKDLDYRLSHFSLIAYVLIVAILAGLSVSLLIFRSRTYRFNKTLARAREEQKDRGEFITTYRHLREHGNSIFIVALEALLGAVLLGAYELGHQPDPTHPGLLFPQQYYLYLFVLMFWTAPGVLIWFFATFLENEFVRDRVQP